ncbi:MAG: hypothetical protein HY959_02395 [Ignavibacteriae bacterium]|nr:hypothetical protein [Ignavibacteriota bacterium]
MKITKFFMLIIIAAFLFTAAESFAGPRYRTCRVVKRVYPAYYSGFTTYVIVKKPKKIHKHHKKIIRKVIYY